MFGFGKKKNKQEESTLEESTQEGGKSTKMEKLVMGAILGVAIGSVLGMTIAPKKGKETRKLIAGEGKKVSKKGFIRNFLLRRAQRKQLQKEEHTVKKIPREFK